MQSRLIKDSTYKKQYAQNYIKKEALNSIMHACKYDFDKTIYWNDSTMDFYLFCLKRHKKIILCVPSLLWALFRYSVSNNYSVTKLKEVIFRFLKYVDVKKDVADFWEINKCKIKTCE